MEISLSLPLSFSSVNGAFKFWVKQKRGEENHVNQFPILLPGLMGPAAPPKERLSAGISGSVWLPSLSSLNLCPEEGIKFSAAHGSPEWQPVH